METLFLRWHQQSRLFCSCWLSFFHSYRINQAPKTSQDSSLTRWDAEQDCGGSQFLISHVIFVVSTLCLQNTDFWKLDKLSKSRLGTPQRLLMLPEAHRLRFEPARKLNKTTIDAIFRCFMLFLLRRRGVSKTGFSWRFDASHVPKIFQAAKENILNLLYESHPAGTQVDGPPRAASTFL